MLPAWLIALAAFLYSSEYVYRFIRFRNYIYLGKALGRFVIFAVYVWIAAFHPGEAEKQVWVRLSLALFLFVDLFYIGQHYFMLWVIKK